MNKNLILIVAIALVVGVGGFFGGMKYQQSKTPSFTRQFGANNGTGRFGAAMQNGNRTGFQPVNGEIISSDDKSITIKMQDGSSKIVLLNDSTAINKAESGSKDDLRVGEKVLVFGVTNSDGSVNAQSIQLNPSDRMMFRQNGQ